MNDGRISTQENFSDEEIELINMFTQEAAAMPATKVAKAEVLARAQREVRSAKPSNGRAATIGRGFAVAASLAILAGGVYLGTRGSDTTPVIPATPSTTSSTVVGATAVSPTDYLVATIANANGDVTVELVDAETGKRVRTIQTVDSQGVPAGTLANSLQFAQVAGDGTVYGLMPYEVSQMTNADIEALAQSTALVGIATDGAVKTIAKDVVSFQLFDDGRRALVVVQTSPDGTYANMVSSLEIVDLATNDRQVVRRSADRVPLDPSVEAADWDGGMSVGAVVLDGTAAFIAYGLGDGYAVALVSLADRDRVVGDGTSTSLLADDEGVFLGDVRNLVAVEGSGNEASFIFLQFGYKSDQFVYEFVRMDQDGSTSSVSDDTSGIVQTMLSLETNSSVQSSRDARSVLLVDWESFTSDEDLPRIGRLRILTGTDVQDVYVDLAVTEQLVDVRW